MAIDLTNNQSIQTNLFVRLDIPGYDVLKFSDLHYPYTIDGESYTALGQLMAVSSSTNELRATPQELTVQISGIPSQNVADVLNYKIKGSSVKIFRAFFNPQTGDLISTTGNPGPKFQGVVSNFDISDDLDMSSQDGTVLITFSCTNILTQLQNKVAGRRTNPTDQKALYPTDVSMDRVLSLENSNFNFGAR